MFKIMVDTNVILDVLLNREPFVEGSYAVLDLCEKHGVTGVVSASCITDLYYIIYKDTKSADTTYAAIGHILNILGVADVTAEDVLRAYQLRARDFEDCLVACCAVNTKCDFVVTRNTADYDASIIPVATPAEFLAYIATPEDTD